MFSRVACLLVGVGAQGLLIIVIYKSWEHFTHLLFVAGIPAYLSKIHIIFIPIYDSFLP